MLEVTGLHFPILLDGVVIMKKVCEWWINNARNISSKHRYYDLSTLMYCVIVFCVIEDVQTI